MCVTSAVMDYQNRDWYQRFPIFQPNEGVAFPPPVKDYSKEIAELKDQLESLRKDVERLLPLLKEAQAYDEATGQPNCEMKEKTALLQALAKHLNIDLSDVLGPRVR